LYITYYRAGQGSGEVSANADVGRREEVSVWWREPR
jgi:hypothetical protein